MRAGCGFFINTYLVMLSVYVNVWVILLLALTDSYMVWVGSPQAGNLQVRAQAACCTAAL